MEPPKQYNQKIDKHLHMKFKTSWITNVLYWSTYTLVLVMLSRNFLPENRQTNVYVDNNC